MTKTVEFKFDIGDEVYYFCSYHIEKIKNKVAEKVAILRKSLKLLTKNEVIK